MRRSIPCYYYAKVSLIPHLFLLLLLTSLPPYLAKLLLCGFSFSLMFSFYISSLIYLLTSLFINLFTSQSPCSLISLLCSTFVYLFISHLFILFFSLSSSLLYHSSVTLPSLFSLPLLFVISLFSSPYSCSPLYIFFV